MSRGTLAQVADKAYTAIDIARVHSSGGLTIEGHFRRRFGHYTVNHLAVTFSDARVAFQDVLYHLPQPAVRWQSSWSVMPPAPTPLPPPLVAAFDNSFRCAGFLSCLPDVPPIHYFHWLMSSKYIRLYICCKVKHLFQHMLLLPLFT